MTRYALIKNDKVENVIVADEEFINFIKSNYDYIENVDAVLTGPGWNYDPITKTFDEPAPPPPPLPSLEEAKSQALAQLKANFQEKAKQPIIDTINGCSWPGGSEIALLIDGNVRLAQQKAATTVDLYDTTGKVHTLAIADAQKVSVLVAEVLQSLYAKKASIAEQINAATTVDDVEKVSLVL